MPAPTAPPATGARTLRLPFDPVLTLAVAALGVFSIVTLGGATKNLIPTQPNYYVDRQATYLIVGFLMMLALSRLDYARLRPLKYVVYGALIFSILKFVKDEYINNK